MTGRPTKCPEEKSVKTKTSAKQEVSGEHPGLLRGGARQMSAEQEDIIIDRVSDMDDAEDQLLAEEKVEKEPTEEVAEVEEDIPTQGRYFTSQKQLDATQLYLNEIGFS
eukprot:CAMPEP_0181262972 /NCGR_PEP_ID=MMETSP1097-20121128/2329_1 /TAXON_ID=35684 /ORGANISM="Pseudopedinella elastica, Strain CCMP716" /LENGTH=108 /DNA_ID=CAMNT_0023361723 /DNA_START=401 /DNA_END=725 /DNA_ORIENTATION=-